MGIFSKTSEYAMRAVFYIAQHSAEGRRVGIKEIARKVDSPEPFLAKVLQDLSRKGLVHSAKGPNGGFYLKGADLDRPVADIIACLEGDGLFVGCGMGLDRCAEKNPCPLHTDFKRIRAQIADMLTKTTIGQFNEQLETGQLNLNNND